MRFAISATVCALLAGSCASAANPTPRQIVGWSQDIVTSDGVHELKAVDIGGIKQWISVRGDHRANPILLYIHGGPGLAMMPASWSFQRPWEEYFTVVQWDERGAGKTYTSNDPAKVAPTLSIPRLTDDAIELVRYLRTTYHKDKIFVLGHSFGSIIGLDVARSHPEWLYAYIGTGQGVNMRDNERLGYATTLAIARHKHLAQAVRELEALVPFVPATGPLDYRKTVAERKWSLEFGGETWNRPNDHYESIIKLSPDYTDADVAAFDHALTESATRLWGALSDVDFNNVTKLDCPIFILQGRHDLDVSPVLAARWLARLQAPKKKLVWFEDSAHMPMMEEPGKFFDHLLHDVRPLAGPVPD